MRKGWPNAWPRSSSATPDLEPSAVPNARDVAVAGFFVSMKSPALKNIAGL